MFRKGNTTEMKACFARKIFLWDQRKLNGAHLTSVSTVLQRATPFSDCNPIQSNTTNPKQCNPSEAFIAEHVHKKRLFYCLSNVPPAVKTAADSHSKHSPHDCDKFIVSWTRSVHTSHGWLMAGHFIVEQENTIDTACRTMASLESSDLHRPINPVSGPSTDTSQDQLNSREISIRNKRNKIKGENKQKRPVLSIQVYMYLFKQIPGICLWQNRESNICRRLRFTSKADDFL